MSDRPGTGAQEERFRHLWDRSDSNWAVLQVGPGRYMPFNRQGFVTLIGATGLNDLVCQRMIDAGCEVLKELPSDIAEAIVEAKAVKE